MYTNLKARLNQLLSTSKYVLEHKPSGRTVNVSDCWIFTLSKPRELHLYGERFIIRHGPNRSMELKRGSTVASYGYRRFDDLVKDLEHL